MYYFKNDYSEGAHPQVLEALSRTNLISTPGYGMDPFCQDAADQIKHRFDCPDADVHFLVGGTQANTITVSAFLRPWEAIIAASTAHIAVHETGAIEATGHKIYVLETPDGKLTPELIRQAVFAHRDGNEEHMVLPRMVYISNSTELGTIYRRSELAAISQVCQELDLYLYLDGARLASALTSAQNDVKPEDLACYCDAFYIGGTKNGLLFGEAVVIVRDNLKPFFRNCIKQRGGMLAKGRLLGVQFSSILKDDLWLEIARHANRLAVKLAEGIQAAGYSLYVSSPTNQIFVTLPNSLINRLLPSFSFEHNIIVDATHTAIRLVTSWATEESAVDAFLAAIQ